MMLTLKKQSVFAMALVALMGFSSFGFHAPEAKADLSPRARAVVRDAAIGAAVGTGVGLIRTSNWWNGRDRYNDYDRNYGGSYYNNRHGYRDFNGHPGRARGHYKHRH
jgi:hypothetical protein